MRLPAIALATALLLGAPSVSAAESVAEQPTTRFYGWQNLLVDYGAGVLAFRGFWSQNPLMAGTGAVAWAFGGSVVHAAHGNTGAAVLSPVIQVGVPLVFYGIGAAASDRPYHREENGALFALVGVLLAPIGDALLGREKLVRDPPKTVVVAPTIERERIALSVVGTF